MYTTGFQSSNIMLWYEQFNNISRSDYVEAKFCRM